VPVPLGVSPELGAYLQDLEDRLGRLENPQSPVPAPPYATADMPPAEEYPNTLLLNTTLNILAASDGVDWIRQDTGAAI
jgi:hypothetical protein